MAKRTVLVHQPTLTESIGHAEKDGPLKNLGELWQAAAKIYNLRINNVGLEYPEITHSVVMLRANEWKLPRITVAGKKGRGAMTAEQKAAMQAGRVANRRSKSEKFAENPEIVSAFEQIRARTPERFLPVLDQAENGSRTAAVKLHCLECSCWQTSEVRKCNVMHCALWPFRPYQGAVESDESPEVVEPELEEAIA